MIPKLNHRTTKLRALCKRYQKNRADQNIKRWNKSEDLELIFVEMRSLGLSGISSSAGAVFSGFPDTKYNYFVSIDEDKIYMGKTTKGFFAWIENK